MTPLRVVFLGELSSTFGRLHYAVLAKHCEVVLWVAGKRNSNSAPPRARFHSRREFLNRLMLRGELEWRAFAALGLIPSRIQVRCPSEPMPKDTSLFAARLEALSPDLIISAGFSRIVPESALGTARLGAFNCHPSPLPRYAGSNPWFWMLKCGEREGGVTIHRMVVEADAGEIVQQRAFPIPPRADHQWLYNTSSVMSAALLRECISDWHAGEFRAKPQDLLQRTYFRAPREEDYRISWNQSALEILNLIRAAHPAPGAWTTLDGRRFTVCRASVAAQRNGVSGQGLALERNGVVVACQDGALVIHAIEWNGRQYNGGREMQALGIRDGVFGE